eukprot:TRINITY_DN6919_c1_g1_i2.p1 TRINITY_DN6919_c1_g1~~TRINITY_DN6919_c1_g1_i2.p1  ORF type:complete len:218 (-),score=-0.60 TRINITY_DN6919_c1_g1_i2:11-664(-)
MCVYILTNIETFCKFFQNVSNVTMFLLIQLSSTMLFVPNKLSSHKNTQTNFKKKGRQPERIQTVAAEQIFGIVVANNVVQISEIEGLYINRQLTCKIPLEKSNNNSLSISIIIYSSLLTQQLLFQLYDLSCIQYTSERFAINQVKILRFLIVPANQNLNVQYVKKLENLNQQDKFWINSLEVFQSVCNPFLFQDIFFQIAIHFEQKKSTQILCCKAF